MTVTPPDFGGCVWPTDPSCLSDDWAGLDDAVRDLALMYASASLERLVAGRVGNCPIKLRPGAQSRTEGSLGLAELAYTPRNWGGTWVNERGCAPSVCEIDLPAPVGAVYQVLCNGVELDPADYRIDNGHLLVWQGAGECPFVWDQNMALPDSEPGTMSVTYLNAYPVDRLGANAVTLLAMEFAKACVGLSCALPSGVVQLVRQGVTMQLVASGFSEGKTGMRIVDAYINLWNPRLRKSAGAIYSPDLPKHRVMSGPISIDYEVIDGGDPDDFDGGAP